MFEAPLLAILAYIYINVYNFGKTRVRRAFNLVHGVCTALSVHNVIIGQNVDAV